MSNYFDKNLLTIKKFVDIVLEIDQADKQLEEKIKKNEQDLKFYNDLLEEANQHFYNIIKNLKDTV